MSIIEVMYFIIAVCNVLIIMQSPSRVWTELSEGLQDFVLPSRRRARCSPEILGAPLCQPHHQLWYWGFPSPQYSISSNECFDNLPVHNRSFTYKSTITIIIEREVLLLFKKTRRNHSVYLLVWYFFSSQLRDRGSMHSTWMFIFFLFQECIGELLLKCNQLAVGENGAKNILVLFGKAPNLQVLE